MHLASPHLLRSIVGTKVEVVGVEVLLLHANTENTVVMTKTIKIGLIVSSFRYLKLSLAQVNEVIMR